MPDLLSLIGNIFNNILMGSTGIFLHSHTFSIMFFYLNNFQRFLIKPHNILISGMLNLLEIEQICLY